MEVSNGDGLEENYPEHEAYATGVLVPKTHHRLVAQIEPFAKAAGITPNWIWTPLSEACGPDEIEWVQRFKFHRGDGRFGLFLLGLSPDPPVERRMAAIAGALIRNFINARVMMVHELIGAADEGSVPDTSCLLVPNFFLGKAQGGHLPAWRVSLLVEALLQRYRAGLQTVVYVSDLAAMSVEYGPALTRHLENHYYAVEL